MEDLMEKHQLEELNKKLDIVLDFILEQKQRRQFWDDLYETSNKIGNEIFKYSVSELDKHNLQLNYEDIKFLLIRFLKNVQTFNDLLESLRTLVDLKNEVGPIANEMIRDLSLKLAELEAKGVFFRLQNVLNYLQQPSVFDSLERMAYALSKSSFPKKEQKISMFSLLKLITKKETKQTLFFLLNLLKLIGEAPLTSFPPNVNSENKS